MGEPIPRMRFSTVGSSEVVTSKWLDPGEQFLSELDVRTSAGFGADPDRGARSILAARFWLQSGGAKGARYVFHFREHTGS